MVFSGRGGASLSNQAFNKKLAAACRAAGMEVITAHDLRHSAASPLLNELGRNLQELQDLRGHKNLSITARYTHIDRGRLRSVVDGLSLASAPPSAPANPNQPRGATAATLRRADADHHRKAVHP